MNFPKNKYFEYVGLSAIFLIAGFFSFFHLTEAPAVWYDEGYYTQIARNIALQGVWGIQEAPGIFTSIAGVTAGYPLIAPVALSYKIFGIGVFSGRFVAAMYILAVVLMAYFFVRRLFGVPAALASGILLATFPVLYGGGKSILGEVPAFFFLITALFFFERALELRKKTDIALAGIFLGVMASAKVTFLLAGLPAFGLAVLLYRRRVPCDFASIFAFFAGFLPPFLLWIATQFSKGDTVSSVLKFYFNPYSVGLAISSFSANVLKFFTEVSPLYLLLLTLVWATALFLRFFRRENISFSETVSFIFTLLIYVVFLKSPGWYRYFFPAQLVVFLFAPNAILILFRSISFRFSFLKKSAVPSVIFLIIFLSSSQLYQTFCNSFVAEYYNSKRTALIESYFASNPNDKKYFLYNVPELVIFLPNDNYYQYIINSHVDQVFGGAELKKIKEGIPDIIILPVAVYKERAQNFALYAESGDIAGRYVVLQKK
ncbi:MAG: glycosyltransferase family 39 protein [Candidatus Paceibacterota bacterium]|jgi:4-amino-4-deoxy-L-arabinose transferase-like glycosyltransferase